MTNRNLTEPDRAFTQLLGGLRQRIRNLERSAARPGATRAQDCTRAAFTAVVHDPLQPNDGYWVYHPMAELDIESGRWLVQGWLQFELKYTHVAGQLGYEKMTLALFSSLAPGSSKSSVVAPTKAPMAAPIDVGVGTAQTNLFDVLNFSVTVSSDTGLHLSMEALMEVNGSNFHTATGTDFWLGPGQLLATPL